MAANAYTGRFIMHAKNGGGNRTKRFAASDVANAFITFPDLDSDKHFYVPTEDGAWVVDDITADEDGEDTGSIVVIKGSSQTESVLGLPLLNNMSTTPQARCQGLYGREFTPGNRYAFKQLAV